MVNDFKIKKHWIITLSLILCSLSSFAQKLSDATIGFDADKVMISLKEHGVRKDKLNLEVERVREMKLAQYISMQKSQDAILQKIKKGGQQTKKSTSKTASAPPAELALDKSALIALYNSTNGSGWTNVVNGQGAWPVNDPNAVVTSWNPDTNTGWYGVQVDSNGRVISLMLSSNNLSGTLPAQLGALEYLTSIFLSSNKLTGSIPTEITQCTELSSLFLNSNQLTGTIPTQIGSLTKLETLFLSSNKLTGSIPSQIGLLRNISTVILDSNQLTGTIPAEIGQCKLLSGFSVFGNKLTGKIPVQFTVLPNLYGLNLENNQFSGTIPQEFGQCQKLTTLSLAGNQLSGSIPASLGLLSKLQYLSLDRNLLTGNIPTELTLCKELRNLRLDNNQLTGKIPAQFSSLVKLQWFSININMLEGKIPDLTATSINYLDVSQNKFRFVDFPLDQFSYYNTHLSSFAYAFQAKVDHPKTLTAAIGASLTLKMYEDDDLVPNESFQWYKGNIAIAGATSREYTIANITPADATIYKCISTQPQITQASDFWKNLILETEPITIETISGACTLAGTIKPASNTVTTNTATSFSFETTDTRVLTYTWTFYNLNNTINSTATTSTAEKTYDVPGNYNVELRTKDINNCENVYYKTINVTPKCNIITGNIKLNPEEPVLNQVTNFSLDSSSSGLTYIWTFYNANNTVKEVQTTAIATQTYTNRGDYKVSLTVTDMNGCTNTFEKTIRLRGECGYYQNLNGSIYSPYPYGDYFGVILNQPVNIRYYKVNQSAVLNYEWSLYNSNGFLMQSGDQETFPINITNEGEYLIKLRVSDYSNCYTTERTIKTRGPIENCVVPASDRGAAYIDGFDYRGVVVNTPTPISLNYTAFSITGFTFKWELFNPEGILVGTSNNETFPVTLPTLGDYKINLQIKDPLGCVTDYTETLPSVELCTYNANSDDFSIFGPNDYTSGRVSFINAGESMMMRPYFWQGKPVENNTYSWKLYNPQGEEIGTGTDPYLQITLTQAGYHKITLVATDIATGCVISRNKTMDCLIGNSCTVNNDKSTEVKNLYVNFLKKLIVRSVLGETDEQINASVATPEYMELKPYIKNGVGDKIYNFVSTIGENGSLGSFNFSFSPNREYDVHIYNRFGIQYDPEYHTIEDLNYKAESLIYTDISQYINADDFFVSCYVQSESKRAKTGKETNKVILEPYECTTESEVRNIIFCPGEESNCTPEIIGIIKSATPYIYPNELNAFSFETTVPNLTYSWTITSEAGDVLSTSNADITVPFAYTFANEGIYFIKLVAKNQTGCTTNFTKKITVDNKRCASEANSFVFETEAANVNYTWTTTDITGNTVDTVTNTTGVYSFTTNIPGTYEVKLTANAEEKCETIFTKTIFVENCTPVVIVSCTQNNPLTPKIHRLFIDLINKLASTPNGVDANIYAKNEIAALVPYTYSPRAKIFNFNNDTSSISFSFTEDAIGKDVYLPKSNLGTITGIDLDKYEAYPYKTIVETHYSNGSYDAENGYVKNIDFCPSQECTPLVGTISIVKRTANATKPVSTVLPTKTYKYEGIWLSNATQQPEVNAWVDYKDASGVQKRTLIGAITNGCTEIIASSIVNTNGVDVCSDCQELHVESQNTELCYKVTYLDCSGQIKTLVTDATTVFPGKRIISAVQQGCDSTSPPPVETSKTTTTSSSSRI